MQKKKHNKAQDLSDQTRKHRMRESLVESGPASGLRPGAPRLILLIASKDLSPSYEYEAGFRRSDGSILRTSEIRDFASGSRSSRG